MRSRLNLILLGVADVARSAEFYSALGWQRSPRGSAAFVLFDLGGVAVALQSREAMACDAGYPDAAGNGFTGMALAYIARNADDVYWVLDKAVALGATLAVPARATAWGHSGYFRDLDGHLIEVLYEDGWQFDAHDNLVLD